MRTHFLAALLCLGVLNGSAFSAGSLNWANSSALVDSGGTAIPNSSTYVIRMYESPDDATIEFGSDGLPYGGDIYTGLERTWITGGLPGYFFITQANPDTYGIAQGDRVYSVIYNSSSYGTATEYCIIDQNGTILPSLSPSGTYDVGGNVAGDWVTIVPEPTTLALFATGVGVLMMRRRKKQAGETEQFA